MAAKKKTIRSTKTQKTVIANHSTPLDSSEKRSAFIWGVGVVVLLAFLFIFRGAFIAATVNNHPISRLKVIKELEKRSGKQTLDALITRELILDEARKKHIVVNDDEINTEEKKIKASVESQGQKFDALLQAQGMTKDDLHDQLLISKTMEKLLAGSIAVSDKEVDKFLEDNKGSIPQDASPEAIKASAKTQLQQQKLSQKAQEYVAQLKKNAKISYFVNY